MNIEYLNSLPEVSNEYNVELKDGEKVVFTAKLNTFGTEKDSVLGRDDSKFTLTNRRIIADNNLGFWPIDLANDVVSCNKVKGGILFFKYVYFSIELNKTVSFDNGTQTLSGYHFYFNEEDTNKFEQIINNLK